MTRLTLSGHRPNRNTAAQQAPAGPYGVLIILGRARQRLTRFRTIQVCPKDLRVLRRQAKMR
jgi:hypothetical protein